MDFIGRGERRGWLASLLRALAASIAAGLAAIFVLGPLAAIKPHWIGLALEGFLVGAVWMYAGLRLTPDRVIAPIVLFLPGVAAAWFLSIGIVHSVSPYFGLTGVAAACVGASLSWFLSTRQSSPGLRTLSIAVPLASVVLVFAHALASPVLGAMVRPLMIADTTRRVPWVWTDGGKLSYVWLRSEDLAPATNEQLAMLESDPGSGAGRVRLTRLTSPSEIGAACDLFETELRQQIRGEIAEGIVPAFVTRLPLRRENCAQGTVWRAADAGPATAQSQLTRFLSLAIATRTPVMGVYDSLYTTGYHTEADGVVGELCPVNDTEVRWLADSKILSVRMRGDTAHARTAITTAARQVEDGLYSYSAHPGIQEDTVSWKLVRGTITDGIWKVCGEARGRTESERFGVFMMGRTINWPRGGSAASVRAAIDSIRRARNLPIVH